MAGEECLDLIQLSVQRRLPAAVAAVRVGT
jgi:hypothetical protein